MEERPGMGMEGQDGETEDQVQYVDTPSAVNWMYINAASNIHLCSRCTSTIRLHYVNIRAPISVLGYIQS